MAQAAAQRFAEATPHYAASYGALDESVPSTALIDSFDMQQLMRAEAEPIPQVELAFTFDELCVLLPGKLHLISDNSELAPLKKLNSRQLQDEQLIILQDAEARSADLADFMAPAPDHLTSSQRLREWGTAYAEVEWELLNMLDNEEFVDCLQGGAERQDCEGIKEHYMRLALEHNEYLKIKTVEARVYELFGSQGAIEEFMAESLNIKPHVVKDVFCKWPLTERTAMLINVNEEHERVMAEARRQQAEAAAKKTTQHAVKLADQALESTRSHADQIFDRAVEIAEQIRDNDLLEAQAAHSRAIAQAEAAGRDVKADGLSAEEARLAEFLHDRPRLEALVEGSKGTIFSRRPRSPLAGSNLDPFERTASIRTAYAQPETLDMENAQAEKIKSRPARQSAPIAESPKETTTAAAPVQKVAVEKAPDNVRVFENDETEENATALAMDYIYTFQVLLLAGKYKEQCTKRNKLFTYANLRQAIEITPDYKLLLKDEAFVHILADYFRKNDKPARYENLMKKQDYYASMRSSIEASPRALSHMTFFGIRFGENKLELVNEEGVAK